MEILFSSFTKFWILVSKHSCIMGQSNCTYLMLSNHNLALPARARQNLLTFWSSGKLWVSIQSLVLNRFASTSSSAFPANSGLKYDQFYCCGLAIKFWEFRDKFGGWFGCCGWFGSSVGASKSSFGTWFGSGYFAWLGCGFASWFCWGWSAGKLGWSGSTGDRSGNLSE